VITKNIGGDFHGGDRRFGFGVRTRRLAMFWRI